MAGRTLAEVYVSVRGDTGQLSGDIHQGIRRVDTSSEGAKAGHSYGSAFGSSAKRVIGGIGALVAAAGIGQVIKESVSGFRDHQKVVAQTNAVIRSTKGAAGISAKAMSDYSDSLERHTKVDGDVILAGENMLATFTNVQNRAGKGNDIFNQSTRTLLDLAAATGTDAPKAAIQLGKALNDPIKGVSALSRVGVTFDAQQVKQITHMQKAGNVAGAQKIVLRELNKEFGGSAKAQGDALGAQGRLIVAWHQAQDTLGSALLPVVNEFEDALAERLPGAADKAAAAIKTGQLGVSAFIAAFKEGDVTSDGFVGFMERAGVAVRNFNGGLHEQGPVDGYTGKLNTLGLGIRALIAAYREGDVTSDGFIGKMEQIGVSLGRVRDYLKGLDFKTFSADARDAGSSLSTVNVSGFAQQLKSVDTTHFADGLNVLGAGLGFVAEHIDLVVKALPFLLAGYALYKASETAANFAALGSLPIKVAQTASNVLLARSLKSLAASNVENTIATGSATAAEGVQAAVTNITTASVERNRIAIVAQYGVQQVVALASKAWAAAQWLVNAALSANPIGLVIVAVAALAAGIIYAYRHSEAFRNIVNGAFHAVAVSGQSLWNDFLKPAFDAVRGALSAVGGAAKALYDHVLKPYFQFIINAWLTVAGAIVNGAAKAFGWVPGIGGKLKGAADAFNRFRDRVNGALSGVKSHTVTVTAKLLASQAATAGIGTSGSGGRAQRIATGGPVFGAGTATSDSIPAMLSNGEHVLTAREVKGLGGHGAVMRMREAARGFAAGGPVGFSIAPQLDGMDRFEKAIDAFNNRVDAMARKLAAASGFSADLNGVVNFARSMAGAPYVWGGASPSGADCSGFVSMLVEVARGQRPGGRLFSTGTLPAGYFATSGNVNPAFRIGWFAGNPGHVAATVNGIGMESRGGDGTVVNGFNGSSRGADYGFFSHHAYLRLARGGPVLPGDPPFDLLDRRGRHFKRGLADELQAAMSPLSVLDSGGELRPGLSAVWNGTGQPERVRTGRQEDALLRELRGLRKDIQSMPAARIDGRVLRREVNYQNIRNPGTW